MIEINEEYNEIAQELLELPEFEEISPFVRFVVLASDNKKTSRHRIVFGQCILVSEVYQWCCPYDFMIVIYDQNIEHFNNVQLRTLIRHEMHHMGYDTMGIVPKPYLVPHDVEEFEIIIKECGLHWEELMQDAKGRKSE